MTKSIPELTYKIVAFSELEEIDTNESIDWAIEMMELGYESPSLLMLASFNKPTNYFEVINYIKDSVKELGLEMKSGDEAVLSYASYYVHQIAKGQRVKDNLTELYRFCQMRDYDNLVYDFYLLYWAWEDLNYEDIDYSEYWHGAEKNNIEQTVIDEAKNWIEKNKKHYAHYEAKTNAE